MRTETNVMCNDMRVMGTETNVMRTNVGVKEVAIDVDAM